MSTISINGVDLELNMLDADVMEKYETLNYELVNKIKDMSQYEGLTNSEGMRVQCRYLDEFFDGLFGRGTAQRLFNGNNDLGMRMDAFAMVADESGDIDTKIKDISNKYGVGRLANREQNQKKQRYNNRAHSGIRR